MAIFGWKPSQPVLSKNMGQRKLQNTLKMHWAKESFDLLNFPTSRGRVYNIRHPD